MNKKIIAVIAVVVAVAVSITGVWYRINTLKSQEKTGFTDVIIKDYNLGSDSVTINIMSIPPEYSGEAKIEISYGENVVYPEHPVNINKGYGSVAVAYNEFVTENGNYTVEVVFKNKTATSHFNINFVVEDVTILANAVMDVTPKIWVQIPLGTTDINMSIDILKNDEIFNNYENEDFNSYNFTGGCYEGKYQYAVSGNYTIRANWTNNKVKDNSPYKNPPPKSSSFLINLAPVAKASPATQETSISEDDGWAYFYGGNSTDYDDDDGTLIYMWLFDTDHDATQTNETNMNDTRTEMDTSYQYTEDDLGGIIHLHHQPKDHSVCLVVKDRWFSLTKLAGVDGCTVTVSP